MASPEPQGYSQYPAAMIVSAFELSETALQLSKVIEDEAKRRSAAQRRGFRVEQNFPVFKRMSMRLRSSVSRTKRSATTVAPTMDVPMVTDSKPAQPEGGPPQQIADSSRSMTARPSIARSIQETSFASDDGFESPGWRERVWVFFDDPQSSTGAYYFSISLFFFITMSTVIFIAQTEKALDPYKDTLNTLEAVCAGVFSVEYVLRGLSSPSKWQFVKNFGNWIDLAAILPFYLEAIVMVENAGSFGAIRIVRLTRVARVLKMSRYSSAIQVFVQAIAISIKALSMLLFLMGIAVVVFSSAIYFAEYTFDGCRHGGWIGQCDSNVPHTIAGSIGAASAAGASVGVGVSAQCVCIDPNPYSSIATSFWWSIVTMSTVGYGDMTPVTLAGRVVGAATILTGMLVLALPITVIGTNFQKVMKSVMQQTMKNNVDYLKGKKQICRQEIQAILQRFHAVTEDIHLSIEDVIAVYDTDHSGTLEDEELRRFRQDLEMLQNRAYMNMNMDLGSPTATALASLAVASPAPPPASARATSSRLVGTLVKKLSGRSGPSFPLGSTTDHSTATTPSPTPSRSPSPPLAAKPGHQVRSTLTLGSMAVPMARPVTRDVRPMVRATRSQPSNLTFASLPESVHETDTGPAHPESSMAMDSDMDGKVSPAPDGGSPDQSVARTSPRGPAGVSGAHADEAFEEELENAMRETSPSPVSSVHPDSELRPVLIRHRHSEPHACARQSPQRGVSQSARVSHDHDLSDEDALIQRMMEVFDRRLRETEARLETKLLNLTKILVRVENMIEQND